MSTTKYIQATVYSYCSYKSNMSLSTEIKKNICAYGNLYLKPSALMAINYAPSPYTTICIPTLNTIGYFLVTSSKIDGCNLPLINILTTYTYRKRSVTNKVFLYNTSQTKNKRASGKCRFNDSLCELEKNGGISH